MGLQQVQYIDDVGFFFEDVRQTDYFAVDNIKEVFNFEKQPDGKFLDFAINFGTGKDTVRRNYKRIQSVIAEVGGLFKGIILTSLILKIFLFKKDVYNYLDYFLDSKESSSNNIIANKLNVLKDKKNPAKFEVSEQNRINSSDHRKNPANNMNLNSINNPINNNPSKDFKNNLDNMYEDWLEKKNEKNGKKTLVKNEVKSASLEEIKKKNNKFIQKNNKDISAELTCIVRNYLDQKEFLKTIIDLNIIKKILFNEDQHTKLEEMSRDLPFVLEILKEKEEILFDVILSKEN